MLKSEVILIPAKSRPAPIEGKVIQPKKAEPVSTRIEPLGYATPEYRQ